MNMNISGRDRPKTPDEHIGRTFNHPRISRGNSSGDYNRRENSRTLKISGFNKDTPLEAVKAFVEAFGPSFNFQNNIPNFGSVSFSMYDIRNIIQIKINICHQKSFDTKLYCDSEFEKVSYCDSILLQPKFMNHSIVSDQIKNELMSYGDISACIQLINNSFLVRFYDCRVPAAIIESGPKLINSHVFIPSYSNMDTLHPSDTAKHVTDSIPQFSRPKLLEIIQGMKNFAKPA
ncbi:hypothetical protein TVAG_371900 [Trichomonas vaginalis G3]|uniref:RRM domain-containing protein n=1 Tax=Trichomonas vaginalis (strain ATCC PRA-98 / G3) TaxID=412133 RepID=A2E0W1_TRIV3|nr:hypothetical protein TVAGG3_0326160 [Trichomonas vaginalis G3]EAY13716.1 hypothetical protein TVAG_371900 [Trichomonas vaginalis G3]KAI5529648.1 hypothetical protein TVAGG3_0326160 [Trichomonas vaginalis G3]|eukprot:XP_001325939.1 hypothetical protein [Trichomonas vaginalis G3]